MPVNHHCTGGKIPLKIRCLHRVGYSQSATPLPRQTLPLLFHAFTFPSGPFSGTGFCNNGSWFYWNGIGFLPTPGTGISTNLKVITERSKSSNNALVAWNTLQYICSEVDWYRIGDLFDHPMSWIYRPKTNFQISIESRVKSNISQLLLFSNYLLTIPVPSFILQLIFLPEGNIQQLKHNFHCSTAPFLRSANIGNTFPQSGMICE